MEQKYPGDEEVEAPQRPISELAKEVIRMAVWNDEQTLLLPGAKISHFRFIYKRHDNFSRYKGFRKPLKIDTVYPKGFCGRCHRRSFQCGCA